MYRLFIILIAFVTFFSSCEEEKISDVYGGAANLIVGKDTVLFNVAGDLKTITVRGPKTTWSVNDETLDKEWCEIFAADFNSGSFVTITVKENTNTNMRETYFTVLMGDESKKVVVKQIGADFEILTDKDVVEVGKHNSLVHLAMVTNIKFTTKIDFKGASPWITIADEYVSDDKPMKFNVGENTTNGDREADLIFEQVGGDYVKIIPFIQSNGNAEYVPEDMSNVNGNKKLAVVSATASPAVVGREIEKSYDGNLQTFYNSVFVDKPANKPTDKPAELIYNFGEETSLNYLFYTAYSGQNMIKKAFKNTDIYVKCKGDNDYILDQTFNFTMSPNRQIVILKNEYINPVSVKFVVKTDNEAANFTTFTVTCAEMEFYANEMRFKDIFADNTYSTLKSGVTIEQIFAMNDPFYLNIAQNLLYGTYPEARIADYKSYYTMPQRNMKELSPLHNLTGISVTKDEDFIIFADNIGVNAVTVAILDPQKGFVLNEYPLYDGTNKIKASVSGLLYVRYHSPAALPNLRLHIAGGANNLYFDLTRHTNADAQSLLSHSKAEFIDLVGSRVHLIMPVANLKEANGDVEALVAKYNEIVEIQEEFIGLTNQIIPRTCFLVSALKDHESNRVVVIDNKKAKAYCNIETLVRDTLNTVIHQVSHIYQHTTFGALIMESSIELYSQYTRNKLGLGNYFLEKDVYDKAFFYFASEQRKYATVPDTNNENIKTVPFWQLYLYMSEVKGMKDYFAKVHAKLRSGNGTTEATLVTALALNAGIDLTDFFAEYGFVAKPTASPNPAPKMLHYISENNIEMFKEVKPAVAGTYKVTNDTGGKLEKITISGGANCIAYEVRSKGGLTTISVKTEFKIENYLPTWEVYGVGVNGDKVKFTKQNN